ncbi:hypothetical protein PhCBS80983_g00594 [Powellomyces hirtus]|uniref:Cilia- and flagella-associated protein 263 n=1 Tax=Powellomyces hirtus TaxID=109895 RepID=A0A507EEK9_9FUNG|nr:hypothetical protein PhCBS80983_g00594 [Powellomyces hirtus]
MEDPSPGGVPISKEYSTSAFVPPPTPGLLGGLVVDAGAGGGRALAITLLDDADFDAYSDEELVRLHDELTKKTKFLEAENTLFDSFLNRVGPDSTATAAAAATKTAGAMGEGTGFTDVEGQGDPGASIVAGAAATGGPAPITTAPVVAPGARTRKKKGEKPEKQQAPILLTAEQKAEIATRELEELKDEIEKQKEEWGKVLDNYKAEMEEIDIRISETKKAMYEFKRDIVQGAVNARTGKVVAERVLRYYEDKIRAKDATIKKTRLKNSTIKLQKNKLHLQLKQKEEMGEVLHAIDFDQLQIENKQYLAKIEERNTELLKLKMTAGNTQQVLNYHKRKLQSLTHESDILRHEIAQRRDMLSKLIAEADIVEIERAHAEKVNRKIRTQMEDYRVPDVMDYVSINAQQEELTGKLKMWQRKVAIASMQSLR